MISVAEALDAVLALVERLPEEEVPLGRAAGRVLARPVAARRAQPPFRTAVMDGYAVADAAPGERLRVVGEVAAGCRWTGRVGPGEAVRIFTGAPMPDGAARVVIQEDVSRDGDWVRVGERLDEGPHVRPAGADFEAGQQVPARRLRPADIALLAAMNVDAVPVVRRPEVALIATGDELVMPGETPGPAQIVSSNAFGLAALLSAEGAAPRMLPIARDTTASLSAAFELARGADLVVTIGGASVGDHDLVAAAAADRGMDRAFYRVAMRPGKPLMAGRMDGAAMLGLPGNPVSAMVCGTIFVLPTVRAMLGLGRGPVPRETARLVQPLGPNGPREHYMRAVRRDGGVAAFERQDSALLSVLAKADVLIVRPPQDPPRTAGAEVEVIPLP